MQRKLPKKQYERLAAAARSSFEVEAG